jgi:hypothetical protein
VRFFYDTEFIEDGRTIDLVSIGVVDERGREFYAVSTEFNPDKAGPWVRDNVLDKLPSPADPAWCDRATIRDRLMKFLSRDRERVELWAWFAAYDHVALAQLWEDVGKPSLPPPPTDAHDALADARHNLVRWRVIEAERLKRGFPAS